jgi:hypothetical protein
MGKEFINRFATNSYVDRIHQLLLYCVHLENKLFEERNVGFVEIICRKGKKMKHNNMQVHIT